MTTVTAENAIIKYKSGSKMVRVSVDVNATLGKKFKEYILEHSGSMAGLIRDFIEVYLKTEKKAFELLLMAQISNAEYRACQVVLKECQLQLSKKRYNEIKPLSNLHKKINEVVKEV